MKKLIVILILLISFASQATTFQISDQAAFNAFNWDGLVAGDRVQLNRGVIYYGSITLTASGTAGNPIIIEAYGIGANPIVTGFVTVASWTNLGSNIWESTSAVSTLSTCKIVSVNGVNTAMGRYPNSNASNGGYLSFQSHVGHTSITSSSLSGTPNWTGAEVNVRTSRWTIDRTIIASQSGGTLNFTALPGYEPINGFGFFIQNDSRTLDIQNEWYFDASTKKIKFFSATQPTNVKLSTVETLLTIAGDYITVDGIDFTGANSYAIYNTSGTVDHVTIQNCNISFIGHTGIKFRCATLNIENCTINHINDTGVDAPNSSFVTIKNNTINNIGQLIGMGSDGNGTRHGISCVSTDNQIIEGNNLTNIGYIGIEFYGNNVLIKNNFIDGFCNVLDDGGGIYTYVGTQTSKSNQIVSANIVVSGIGAYYGSNNNIASVSGIYLDENSTDVEVNGNTVGYSNEIGIFLHNTHSCEILNNNVFNSKSDQILFKDNDNTANGNIITGNSFIAGLSSSTRNSFFRASQGTVINSGGTINNNYYVNLSGVTTPISIYTQNVAYDDYSLSYWQLNFGFDLNSELSPKTIALESDVEIRYNATAATQQVSFSWAGIDMNGTQYSSNPTLQPYTSLVLIKNIPNPTRNKIPAGKNGVMYKTRTGLPIGGE